jgi:hypothetical protein
VADLAELAVRVQQVLETEDLAAFSELLDPAVQWGPPDDTKSGCHNRAQVIAWYSRARAEGMTGRVTEVVVGDGALLVGMQVTRPAGGADEAESTGRWQVLRVRDGLVVDIRGYPERDQAAGQAGVID